MMMIARTQANTGRSMKNLDICRRLGKVRKVFFSEEKKQKTFIILDTRRGKFRCEE